MYKALRELCVIEYGASPKAIRSEDITNIGIYGTGGLVGYSKQPLFSGQIVVVARKGTLDNPIYVEKPCWVIDTAYAAITKEFVCTKWLYYHLLMFDLKKLNESTGVPSISRDYLYKQRLYYLSYPEQQKIANILSCIDKVIEKTEAAIEKYKSIKTGMMQDLFTRGIDIKTGKLRPSYKDAPQLYKNTELGWIPKEWEVDILINNIDEVIDNRGKTPVCSDAGIPLLEIKSLDSNKRYPDYESVTKFVSDNVYDTWFRQYIRENDILISTVGSLNLSTIMDKKKAGVAQNIIGLRIRKNQSPDYYYYLTKHEEFITQINRLVMNAVQPSLKVPHLLGIKHIKPSLVEQEIIANKLMKIDSISIYTNNELIKYKNMKLGLMSALLTGKVRVKLNEDISEKG